MASSRGWKVVSIRAHEAARSAPGGSAVLARWLRAEVGRNGDFRKAGTALARSGTHRLRPAAQLVTELVTMRRRYTGNRFTRAPWRVPHCQACFVDRAPRVHILARGPPRGLPSASPPRMPAAVRHGEPSPPWEVAHPLFVVQSPPCGGRPACRHVEAVPPEPAGPLQGRGGPDMRRDGPRVGPSMISQNPLPSAALVE